jgi:hypothetical protein
VLNSQGCVQYEGKRNYVCRALAGEEVALELLQNRLVVQYRRTWMREIDLHSGRSLPIVSRRHRLPQVSAVVRIWRSFGLQPHRSETFKLSTDPWLVEKVRDIVGLYLNPPEHAIVLCVDEKSQVQALDRTQPILPLRPGLPEQRTNDYERHGTTSLFGALDIATGNVIGKCHCRNRHQEFLKFMQTVDAAVPRMPARYTSWWTITAHIKHPALFAGSPVIRDSSCTSPQPAAPG